MQVNIVSLWRDGHEGVEFMSVFSLWILTVILSRLLDFLHIYDSFSCSLWTSLHLYSVRRLVWRGHPRRGVDFRGKEIVLVAWTIMVCLWYFASPLKTTFLVML